MTVRAATATVLMAAAGTVAALGVAGCGEPRHPGPDTGAVTAPARSAR